MMIQLLYRATMLAVFLMLTGCANTLSVTYHSDPPGAVLYQESQQFGYTPTTLNYKVTAEDRKRGFAILRGTTVRWASGASASLPTLRADLSIGYSQQFTFIRPESYPGREADVNFSLELQKLAIMQRQAKAMQRQAKAQEDQAFWQLYNTINQQQQRQQPRIMNCNSTAFGNTVNTTCY